MIERILKKFIQSSSLDHFLVVDVGARNGFPWLKEWYSKNSKIIGFEPNKTEYNKLVKKKTDAQVLGLKFPKFQKYLYYDKVVWEKNGKFNFYQTNAPGRSAVDLKPNTLSKKIFVNGEKFDEPIKNSKIISKESICIDSFFKKKIIDYLKVDVEGSEIFVLNGSKNKFKNKEILFIRTEFMSNNFYKNSSNIQRQIDYMIKFGYRLVDINVNPIGHHRSNKKIFENENKDFLLGGDLYFSIDPDLNNLSEEKKLRLGLVLIASDFKQCGYELIEESKLFNINDLKIIKKELLKTTFLKNTMKIYHSIPTKIYNLLNRTLAKIK